MRILHRERKEEEKHGWLGSKILSSSNMGTKKCEQKETVNQYEPIPVNQYEIHSGYGPDCYKKEISI